MMNERKPVKQPTLIPRLRFPEYRNVPGWDVRELGLMTSKVGSGITPLGGEKNYKTKGRPFIRSQNVGWGEFLLDDVAYIDEQTHRTFDSTEIQEHDVLLNITGASIGRSVVADLRIAGGNVNQHVCIIRVKSSDLNPVLLNQYLISDCGQKQIDSFQAGGNRQGLNFAQIRSFEIPLPPLEREQQKIADCLTSLDDVIAAQGRKVEALKAHKRGLMQQLFPREGETRPRLRFPEFRNAQGWKSTTVKTLISTITPPRKIPTSGYGAEGLLPIIDQSPDPICGWTNDLEAKVDARCPLIVFGDHTCVLKLVEHDFAQGADGIKIIAALAHVDIHFLYFALQADPVSSASYRRHFSLLQEKHIAFPEELKEQQRIADCLSTLDTQITAESHQLTTLKNHKQGLMQQLFPAPEAASA